MIRPAAKPIHLDTSFLIRALDPTFPESGQLLGWLRARWVRVEGYVEPDWPLTVYVTRTSDGFRTEVEPLTGRRHQIRVQLALLGHPWEDCT